MLLKSVLLIGLSFFVAGCATVAPAPQPVEASVSQQAQIEAQQAAQLPKMKKYKMKIIIGRFTNETNYGRALLSDEEYEHMGRQASDMLATRLIQSNRFLVLERPDLNEVEAEQAITKQKDLVGADAVIFGAVTEFGRSVTGKAGFLSSAVIQKAKSSVEIRLVDTKTGQAFFSATGSGQASTEQGQVAGFGNAATYDSTLNDSAIAASISDLINNVIISLANRPWKTDVLKVDGNQVYISGGQYQGIKEGDILFVMKKTESLKSQQSGFTIDLPPEKIATIKVVSLFGDNETNEGSQCQIIDGKIDPTMINQLLVKEGE